MPFLGGDATSTAQLLSQAGGDASQQSQNLPSSSSTGSALTNVKKWSPKSAVAEILQKNHAMHTEEMLKLRQLGAVADKLDCEASGMCCAIVGLEWDKVRYKPGVAWRDLVREVIITLAYHIQEAEEDADKSVLEPTPLSEKLWEEYTQKHPFGVDVIGDAASLVNFLSTKAQERFEKLAISTPDTDTGTSEKVEDVSSTVHLLTKAMGDKRKKLGLFGFISDLHIDRTPLRLIQFLHGMASLFASAHDHIDVLLVRYLEVTKREKEIFETVCTLFKTVGSSRKQSTGDEEPVEEKAELEPEPDPEL